MIFKKFHSILIFLILFIGNSLVYSNDNLKDTTKLDIVINNVFSNECITFIIILFILILIVINIYLIIKNRKYKIEIQKGNISKEELSKTQTFFTAAIEQSPAGIVIADAPDVTIRIVNSKAYSMRGKTDLPLVDIPVEFHSLNWQIYKSDGTMYNPKDLPLSQVILHGKIINNFEAIIKQDDGSEKWILANASPIYNSEGEIIAGIAVFSDITMYKLGEKEYKLLIDDLEVKNLEMEQFIFHVSHDLKSPIVTIKGFLGLIETNISTNNNENKEKILTDLKRISNAADSMQILINELVELSRIGRVINKTTKIFLTDVVKEAIEMLYGKLMNKDIEIIVDEKLPVIYSDKPRILELFMNVLENSIKYMGDQNKPFIEINYKFDNGKPIIYVRDNGKGIDPEYHSKVFDLFSRFDYEQEGTGLGLAIAKKIIDFHGGRIWVESEGYGKGTTICFTLPDKS